MRHGSKTKTLRRSISVATGLSIVLILAAGPARATSSGQLGVIPPQGATYPTLEAQWWQWALQTSVHTGSQTAHPLAATGAMDCGIGQAGGPWFLGGGAPGGPTGPVIDRSCTVPANTQLFMAIYTAWQDNSNCDGLPPTTLSETELRAAVKSSVDSASAMSLTVDNAPVTGLSPPSTTYRAQSPVFSYTTPADSIENDYLCPPPQAFRAQTVNGAVADGVFVLLAPLSVGSHTLHDTVSQGSSVVLDQTYHLTVAAPPGAPTIGSATAGTGQAAVSWTAPANDGGSPVTGYVVTPYVGAVAQTPRRFDSIATKETVTGLSSGTTYTFKVAAFNRVGTGPNSQPSNPVKPK